MKKLFAIVAVAAALTACNGSGDDKTTSTDSTKMTTPAMEASKNDTAATHMMDTAKKMINNATDTMNKAMDKAADKMKDASKMVEKAKEAVKH